MSIQIAYSTNKIVNDAVKDLINQFQSKQPDLLLFFASSIYNPDEISAGINDAFNNSQVFGCSTSGEIVSGKMLSNSVVAMAFDKSTIADFKIEIMENLKENTNPEKAFKGFQEHFKVPVKDMDFDEYFGLVLIDGLSGSEEKLMEKIGTGTNVSFVGGSAGDDLRFKETYVYANGKKFTNAALLVLLKPSSNFEIVKTQSFSALKNKFVATKVNEETREILELDNSAAADVYSNAVSVSTENAASKFMTYPFGVMVGDEPYVRSPQQITGKSIKFYCNVAEGTELTLLHSNNIIKETEEVIKDIKNRNNKISGIINFNCILRTLELQNKNQTDEYGRIFSDIPTIGFSTYGEEYIGHVNQTAVMVIFK
jgi:hypothetical protein